MTPTQQLLRELQDDPFESTNNRMEERANLEDLHVLIV